MESVWASIFKFSREVIKEVVPQARVGYEGSNAEVGAFHAADYWKLAARNEPYMRWFTWMTLFKGANFFALA